MRCGWVGTDRPEARVHPCDDPVGRGGRVERGTVQGLRHAVHQTAVQPHQI